jgi:hypothetical protein
MYAISYDLRQTNNIARTTRNQREHWVESGPTFGVRFRSREIEMSYAFRSSCGNQGCDLFHGEGRVVTTPIADTGGIIAAPSSPLFFNGGSETSHHFMISLPIR